MPEFTPESIAGIILLFTNQPFGWGGLLCFTYLGKKTGKKIYYLFATAIYVLSWGMLCLGMYLAGPHGIAFAKHVTRKYTLETVIVSVVAITLGITIRRWKKKSQAPHEPTPKTR